MIISSKMEGDFLGGLDRLGADLAEKVAFSGAAAMARVFYDEVKLNTQGVKEGFPGVVTGNLRDSIYWARDERASTKQSKVYAVSWNRSKAPHGHLVEFGHWRVNVVIKLPNGKFAATEEKLPAPVWVPAYPFVRPALSKMPQAFAAGYAAMRLRFAKETA